MLPISQQINIYFGEHLAFYHHQRYPHIEILELCLLFFWLDLLSISLSLSKECSKLAMETEHEDEDDEVDISEEVESTETDWRKAGWLDLAWPLSQGCDGSASSDSLWPGSVSRHPWISDCSSGLSTVLLDQSGSPSKIWESDSKGMSPQTMSWRSTPRDQTVIQSAV